MVAMAVFSRRLSESRSSAKAGGGVRHDGHRGAEPPFDLVEKDSREGGNGWAAHFFSNE
ncbi:MAG: hypothetical protein ACKOSQ_12905 [Planctomycetaceae bacterium]